MKSRTRYIFYGDRNAKYYHVSTLIRRNHARFGSIKYGWGNGISDPSLVNNQFQDFFKNLLSSDKILILLESNMVINPVNVLSPCMVSYMERKVPEEEIKKVIFSFIPFKSPGYDGLHLIFYHRNWDIVGKSVCALILKVFEGTPLPDKLNDTLICLIPKSNNPAAINYFRPITLCNTVYKTISKVIVHRTRPLMEHLISPLQGTLLKISLLPTKFFIGKKQFCR